MQAKLKRNTILVDTTIWFFDLCLTLESILHNERRLYKTNSENA